MSHLMHRYPWEPSSGAGGLTKEMLHLRMHRALAEKKRCEEELLYLPEDAKRTYIFSLYQLEVLCRQLDAVMAELPQALSEESVLWRCPRQIGIVYNLAFLTEQQKRHSHAVKQQCALLWQAGL